MKTDQYKQHQQLPKLKDYKTQHVDTISEDLSVNNYEPPVGIRFGLIVIFLFLVSRVMKDRM